MSYRDPSLPVLDPISPLVGVQDICPMCGAKTRHYIEEISRGDILAGPGRPRACSPENRIHTRWWRRCSIEGAHLHQSCVTCKHSWTSLPAKAH